MLSNIIAGLFGTQRAGRAGISDSNYTGQGSPMGSAPLVLLFHRRGALAPPGNVCLRDEISQ